MTASDTLDVQTAHALGRREGFATAALAIGLLSFVNLLGVEKGLLALVLGIAALSGTRIAARRARVAIGLGVLQLCSIALVLILFHEKLGELIALLTKLG